MRRIILAGLVVFTLLPATSRAQTAFWVESQNKITTGNNVEPQLEAYQTKKLSPKFGTTVWALVSESWGEVLVGGTFSPSDWVEMGLSAGIETNSPSALRGGSSLWLGKGRLSLLLLGEKGGSGNWYNVLGTIRIANGKGRNWVLPTDVGIRGARFQGFGPYVNCRMGSVQLWIVPVARDFESNETSGVLGLRVTL